MGRTDNRENGAYTDERQDKFYALEDSSWWYKYRIQVFDKLADRYMDKGKAIVDIGGSNGYNAKKMQDRGWNMILVEPTPKACVNAKERGVKNIVNKAFEDYDDNIEQWFLLDVIELIKDDAAMLKNLYHRTAKGGGWGS